VPAVVLDVGVVSLTGLGVSPGCCVRQVRGAGRLLFAQAGAFEFEAVGTVDDAVDDRVSDGQIPDDLVLAGYGNLACDQQRALVVAVVDDLQQVAPLLGGQRFRPPVIDDQQPRALDGGQHPGQAPFAAGGGQVGEQPRRPLVEHRVALPTGLVAQRAGKPRLAHPGRPRDILPRNSTSTSTSGIRITRVSGSGLSSYERSTMVEPCTSQLTCRTARVVFCPPG